MSLAVVSQTDLHSFPHPPDLTHSNYGPLSGFIVPFMLMSVLHQRKHGEKESPVSAPTGGSRSRVKKLMHDAVRRRSTSPTEPEAATAPAPPVRAAAAISLPKPRQPRQPLRAKDGNTISAGNAGPGVASGGSISIPTDDEHVAKMLKHLYYNSTRISKVGRLGKKETKAAAPEPATTTASPPPPSQSPSDKLLSRISARRAAPPPPAQSPPKAPRSPSKYDKSLPKKPSPLSTPSYPHLTPDDEFDEIVPVPTLSTRRNSASKPLPSARHHGYSQAALNVTRHLWEGKYETWVYRRLKIKHLVAQPAATDSAKPKPLNPDIFPRVGNIEHLRSHGRISPGPNPVVLGGAAGSYAMKIDLCFGSFQLSSIQRTLFLFDLDQRMCEGAPKHQDAMDVDDIPNGRPWENNWELRWQVLAALLRKNALQASGMLAMPSAAAVAVPVPAATPVTFPVPHPSLTNNAHALTVMPVDA